MPALEIWRQPFAAIWPEVISLATKHSEEVDGGVEPRRKFLIDESAMHEMSKAGVFFVMTANLGEKMLGYFTWNVMHDVESKGLLIGQQGAWFVDETSPRRTAKLLWDRSVDELKAMGVMCIFPHHRTQGRGADIGKFFQRHGAKLTQKTYTLWIGGDNA